MSLGGFGGLAVEESDQWVRVESNYFHFYPYAFYYDDETRYLGAVNFWNITPRGVAFLVADLYSEVFVDHIISQIAEGPAMIWASVDAGDAENFWYTEYILKADGHNVLAIHFDLQDVSENPGVSDHWREYMLTRARSDDETNEFKSYVTGRWIASADSVLEGLGEDERALQDIDAQIAHRKRVERAEKRLIDPADELVVRMERLSFDAMIARVLPYPYTGHAHGEALVGKLKELLANRDREVRESAVVLIEEANGHFEEEEPLLNGD